jgi:hypothetical protein
LSNGACWQHVQACPTWTCSHTHCPTFQFPMTAVPNSQCPRQSSLCSEPSCSLTHVAPAPQRMQEANYGHQQELDMIPLMMQKDYSANGWLGLILGTRMWYAMWDAEQDDDAAFNNRLDSVVREIGDRGKC